MLQQKKQKTSHNIYFRQCTLFTNKNVHNYINVQQIKCVFYRRVHYFSGGGICCHLLEIYRN